MKLFKYLFVRLLACDAGYLGSILGLVVEIRDDLGQVSP
jgi:hypothetical protein